MVKKGIRAWRYVDVDVTLRRRRAQIPVKKASGHQVNVDVDVILVPGNLVPTKCRPNKVFVDKKWKLKNKSNG